LEAAGQRGVGELGQVATLPAGVRAQVQLRFQETGSETGCVHIATLSR
jgi:hypothetical protein